MLTLLTKMGACFPYLRPEFLLEYHTYRMYMKHYCTHDDDFTPLLTKINGYPAFVNISRQSWCDLILQTFKVVCLQRLQEQTASNQSTLTLRQTPMLRYQKSLKDIPKNMKPKMAKSLRHVGLMNVLGKGETTLISWMEFHFNTMKKILWANMQNTGVREVDLFGRGLTDGLVFAAITGTYCPYLRQELSKMYTTSTTNEEELSNNIVVIKCWEKINYSFKVTPQDLNRPRTLKLLMLTTYLYEVMPFMYPGETIEIKAGLSEKSKVLLNVRNNNNFKIAYKAIFFSNDMNCFSTDESIYEILPKEEIDITIEFYAKFAKTTSATLLLSGEVRTYHYAKNKTINLLGIPNLEYMTSTIKITTPLYTVKTQKLVIKAPYESCPSYAIKICHTPIVDCEELEKIPFYDPQEDPMYHRIMPLDNTLVCNDGVGKLKVVINVIVERQMNSRIYFSHKEFGEFAIAVITKVTPRIIENSLIVKVPKVRKKYDRIYMDIPSRNEIVWKCFKQCILRVTTGNTRMFWEKNIGLTSGMHLFHALILSNTDTMNLFCQSLDFKLFPEKEYAIQFPEEVTLQDVCSTGHTSVGVVFSRHLKLPVAARFRLESTDSQEDKSGYATRYYLATFVYDE